MMKKNSNGMNKIFMIFIKIVKFLMEPNLEPNFILEPNSVPQWNRIEFWNRIWNRIENVRFLVNPYHIYICVKWNRGTRFF